MTAMRFRQERNIVFYVRAGVIRDGIELAASPAMSAMPPKAEVNLTDGKDVNVEKTMRFYGLLAMASAVWRIILECR